MKANVGDWLVIKGTTTERSDQRGLITEVHSADGSPPYVVRWLAPAMWRRWFPALTHCGDTRGAGSSGRAGTGTGRTPRHQRVGAAGDDG
jgi:hypothetical protein